MCKEKENKTEKLRKEENAMAAISKPSVFEVKVTEQTKKGVLDKINEIRLTKSFFDECAEISKRLRKDKTDK